MNYADVIGPIQARVEGCPRALVVDALRNAVIDFCIRTRWLTTGASVVDDGEQSPRFDLAEQVIDICEARIDDEPIGVYAINDPDLDDLLDTDNAITFTDPNFVQLRLPGTVASPITVDFLLVIAPGPDSTEIYEPLWRRWSEQLKHGALHRLYEEPNRPWSSPANSTFHGAKFEAAITDAAAEAGRNRFQPARRLRTRPA
jgi:hypothetical protein